jgi:lambda family phage portal protein
MTERKPYKPTPSLAHRVGAAVDTIVSVFAPEWGERRKAVRSRSIRREIRNASTDAGESTNLRDGKWLGSRLSPDAAIEQDISSLRARSRELYRTDSIGGVVDSRVNLVVSYGPTPQARIREREGLITAEQAKTWNVELEEIYEQMYSRMSKSGKQTLWQMLRLIERHHGCDGESFTILSDRGDAEKPIPLTLEVIDPERVETPPEHIANPRVRMGVETDKSGRIVAYHVRDAHPGDTKDFKQTYTRYPADRVLHVFEPWFAGQSRAFPWLTRAINRCRDAKDLDEAAIIGAQVEACHAGFVTSPVGAYEEANSAASDTSNGRRYEDIRPGMLKYLEDGQSIEFGNPTKSNGYGTIQDWNYRRAAVGMNFPAEMVLGNWGGLSFAAGRLSLTDCKLFVRAQQKLNDEAWLSAIWNRLVFESVLTGACTIPPRTYNRAAWLFHRCQWRAPAWPYALTPGEEIDAAITAVDNNIRTKAEVVGEYGGDWEEVAAERAKERAMERDLDIEPATATAVVQQTQSDGDPSPQEAEQEEEEAVA